MNPELNPQLSKTRSPQEIVDRYIELGFKLVFWPRDLGKAPSDARWQQKANNGEYTADQYHEGMNVGVLLGVEISPGRFLVDVDFDWPIQMQLAEVLLPQTLLEFGRSSKACSHLFYTTSTLLTSKAFKDPFKAERDRTGTGSLSSSLSGPKQKAPANIVEFRSANEDGSLGHQTVVPPSIHPSGEAITLDRAHLLFEPYGSIAHDVNNTLPHRIALYAAAYLLYERFSNGTFHHPVRMAAAGFFLSCGLSESDVYAMNEALSHACNNDRKDAKSSVTSTIKNYKKGRVTGRTTLASMIGKEGNKVLLEITKLLGGSMFVTDAKDRISNQSQENIRVALDLMGIQIAFNDFSRQYVTRYESLPHAQMTDQIINHLWLEVDSTFHFRPSKEFFQSVVTDIAHSNTFHPVKDWFANLEPWDQIPRLDTWLIDCAGAADTEYTRAISSLYMIATVRRIMQPGCKFDEIIVLEGEQGQLKSTGLRTLCPRDEWYSDDFPLDADGKIIIERTSGKLMVECADLVGMRHAKIESQKAMMSRGIDIARLSYERHSVEVPRKFTVIATTNSHSYLKDMTGNRRFWPIRVKKFDIELLQSVKNQLWAEAVAREAKGESIRLSPHLYPVAALQQERRLEEDPWEEVIKEHFRKVYKVRTSRGSSIKEELRYRITFNELWDLLQMPIERRTTHDQTRLSAIMTRAGFQKGMVKPIDFTDNQGLTFFKNTAAKGWRSDPNDLKATSKIEAWLNRDLDHLGFESDFDSNPESTPELNLIDPTDPDVS